MILLRGCFCLVRPEGGDLSGVDLLVDGNRIAKIGRNLAAPEGVMAIDASRHVVTAGFVNTHHHFFQTLTRNLPAVQNAKLFDWLVYLYEIWKGVDEEAVYWASSLAMAELLLTGCTCTTDHHYLYPQELSGDLPGVQFEAAASLGIRFAPTRGSMSRSKKDGGLPPDSCVQGEERILSESEAVIRRFHDPSEGSMRRVALAPCSPFSVSRELMIETARLARRHGVRLHTHLAETADEEEYCLSTYGLRPLELMEECEFIGSDVWYAHGIFFSDREIDTLARTGTGVAHCPSSNMRLGSGICRVRDLLDRGAPVGIGVDGSASNDSSDMLGELRQALLLQRVRYGAGGLTAREAYRMASASGARMLGFEKLGTLDEGMIADIALFDVQRLEYTGGLSDPSAALLFCGYNHAADWVIVNGRVAVEHGRLSGGQEEEIRKNAGRVSQRLLERAGIAQRGMAPKGTEG